MGKTNTPAVCLLVTGSALSFSCMSFRVLSSDVTCKCGAAHLGATLCQEATTHLHTHSVAFQEVILVLRRKLHSCLTQSHFSHSCISRLFNKNRTLEVRYWLSYRLLIVFYKSHKVPFWPISAKYHITASIKIITAIQKKNGPKHTTNLAQLSYGTIYFLPKVIFQMPIRKEELCCKEKKFIRILSFWTIISWKINEIVDTLSFLGPTSIKLFGSSDVHCVVYSESTTFLELTDLIEIRPRAPFSISQLNSKVNLMRSCIIAHCLVFWLVLVVYQGVRGHPVDHIGPDVLCPNPRTIPPCLGENEAVFSPRSVLQSTWAES